MADFFANDSALWCLIRVSSLISNTSMETDALPHHPPRIPARKGALFRGGSASSEEGCYPGRGHRPTRCLLTRQAAFWPTSRSLSRRSCGSGAPTSWSGCWPTAAASDGSPLPFAAFMRLGAPSSCQLAVAACWPGAPVDGPRSARVPPVGGDSLAPRWKPSHGGRCKSPGLGKALSRPAGWGIVAWRSGLEGLSRKKPPSTGTPP